jgi:hypothetical protein
MAKALNRHVPCDETDIRQGYGESHGQPCVWNATAHVESAANTEPG